VWNELVIASTGTRTVAVLLPEWVMLRELRFVSPKWSGSAEGCGIRRGWPSMSGTWTAIASRTSVCCGESRQADLGNDAEDAAFTHQLVRESRGMSVSKTFPVTLAFVRARCWCTCRWDCADGIAGPLLCLSTLDIQPKQRSPKRGPSEPRAGVVCTSDPLVFVGGSSTLGGN
jgi:hypothetical protein